MKTEQKNKQKNNLTQAWIALPAIALLSLALLGGCFRGVPSDKEPIHINPNMDTQEKFKPYRSTPQFADSSMMRHPALGTVAQGSLRHDSAYFWGKDSRGNFVKKAPVEITLNLLQRGEERFGIFCTPCHGAVGDGAGAVIKRNAGMIAPLTFHQERLWNVPDGHIFDAITNGIRNMPAYASQIPVADRWAIVAYFRALQRSQNAKLQDIPEDQRSLIK